MLSDLRLRPRAASVSDRTPAPLQPAHLHHDLARILRRSRALINQARTEMIQPPQSALDAIFRTIRG